MRVAESPSNPYPGSIPVAPEPGTTPSRSEDLEIAGLLSLQCLEGLGDRTVGKLVAAFGSARAALSAPEVLFRSVAGPLAAKGRHTTAGLRRARQVVADARNRGLDIITLHDPAYPSRLHDLHDPPPVLFAAGAVDLLSARAVAVVGARRATETGRSIAASLGAELARAGVVVLSGMAMGIDASAHRGALSVSNRTVAVLGGGADRASPRVNEKLYRTIRRRGLVLSEFPPGETPKPHHFPKRNRILAALAVAVVVVEAAEKSGALITVDHALDLGREIYAVPGAITSPASRGTNAMIRDGARALLDPAQLLEELGFHGGDQGLRATISPPLPEDSDGFRLWSHLTDEPRHVDLIATGLGIDTPVALAGLVTLEIQGWASRSPGARFARGPGPHVK